MDRQPMNDKPPTSNPQQSSGIAFVKGNGSYIHSGKHVGMFDNVGIALNSMIFGIKNWRLLIGHKFVQLVAVTGICVTGGAIVFIFFGDNIVSHMLFAAPTNAAKTIGQIGNEAKNSAFNAGNQLVNIPVDVSASPTHYDSTLPTVVYQQPTAASATNQQPNQQSISVPDRATYPAITNDGYPTAPGTMPNSSFPNGIAPPK